MYTAKLAERSNWKRRLNFVETYWKQLAVEANRAGKSENECAAIIPGPESHTYIHLMWFCNAFTRHIGFSGNASKMGIPEGVNSLIIVEGIDCDLSGKPERV